ncbi:hypothetical protein F4803DRAFT_557455 [Xylaria telfairii]|nr:hypothetical protein F4803DRAFT_557455 [Xylaria telfairii]
MGNKEIVQLIDRGAEVDGNIPYLLRRTPLQMASEFGNIEILNLLLNHGPTLTQTRRLAMGQRLYNSPPYLETASSLMNFSAMVLVHEPPSKIGGRWPTEGAAEYDRFEMIEFLWKANS